MTSGQLKARAAAAALKSPKSSTKTGKRPVPARPEDTREITVQRWSQGRVARNPLLGAFVSTQVAAQVRTVKRIPSAWDGLYQDFLKAPRG